MRKEALFPRQIVHVIDDDVSLGESLANLLRSADVPVALFRSPEDFLADRDSTAGGCMVLDIQFPNSSGLDFLDAFPLAGNAMPIILMTGYADVPSSVRGMKAGAVDFLMKPFEDRDLLAAVRAALERDAARRQQEASLNVVAERHAALTKREKEVMALVVRGMMNKQVAGELALSEITVKVHRGTMMRKMNVRTLADLVRAAEMLKTAGVTTVSGE